MSVRILTRRRALLYLGCATVGIVAGYELKQAEDQGSDNKLTISPEVIDFSNLNEIDENLQNKARALEPLNIKTVTYIHLDGQIDTRYGTQLKN